MNLWITSDIGSSLSCNWSVNSEDLDLRVVAVDLQHWTRRNGWTSVNTSLQRSVGRKQKTAESVVTEKPLGAGTKQSTTVRPAHVIPDCTPGTVSRSIILRQNFARMVTLWHILCIFYAELHITAYMTTFVYNCCLNTKLTLLPEFNGKTWKIYSDLACAI